MFRTLVISSSLALAVVACHGSSAAPATPVVDKKPSTASTTPEPVPQTTRPVVPLEWRFVPNEASLLAWVDMRTVRGTAFWPLIQQQLAPIMKLFPACEPTLLDGITGVRVGARNELKDGTGAQFAMRATGTFDRERILACAKTFAQGSGLFRVVIRGEAILITDLANKQLATARWTSTGLEVLRGPVVRGRGPTTGALHLLAKPARSSVLWFVRSPGVNEVFGKPLAGGRKRFDQGWGDLRLPNGGLAVRFAMEFESAAYTKTVRKEMWKTLADGLTSRGYPTDIATVARHVPTDVSGKWITLSGAWTREQLIRFAQTPKQPSAPSAP